MKARRTALVLLLAAPLGAPAPALAQVPVPLPVPSPVPSALPAGPPAMPLTVQTGARATDGRPLGVVGHLLTSDGEPLVGELVVLYESLLGGKLRLVGSAATANKPQPSAAFSSIRTVTLDATGRATTTQRPHQNTRLITPRPDGVAGSLQPLVQVP